ncbi:hypothetical protein ABZ281_47125, partial [Streptomyces sp. NPDC006265]|uniref:hypothetical protein n=1 Tax=Streptomyces sp. NPDC006265 TaxID=3156740 RepID=UPI0033B01C2D
MDLHDTEPRKPGHSARVLQPKKSQLGSGPAASSSSAPATSRMDHYEPELHDVPPDDPADT